MTPPVLFPTFLHRVVTALNEVSRPAVPLNLETEEFDGLEGDPL